MSETFENASILRIADCWLLCARLNPIALIPWLPSTAQNRRIFKSTTNKSMLLLSLHQVFMPINRYSLPEYKSNDKIVFFPNQTWDYYTSNACQNSSISLKKNKHGELENCSRIHMCVKLSFPYCFYAFFFTLLHSSFCFNTGGCVDSTNKIDQSDFKETGHVTPHTANSLVHYRIPSIVGVVICSLLR